MPHASRITYHHSCITHHASSFAYFAVRKTRSMNIRITKLYQGAPWGALEVAFNSCPEGDSMIAEIIEVTGLRFERPVANRFAMRELHIAEVGGEGPLEEAFVKAMAVAEKYGEV